MYNSTRMRKVYLYLHLFRVNQWIKNLIVFTAIIFSGHLFDKTPFLNSLVAFIIFCLLSSASYALNDVIDYPLDKKHPAKQFRPVAHGDISVPEATFASFILILIFLLLSIFFSISFFIISFTFVLLHFLYSLYLKQSAVIDIFTISFSFLLRALGGEVASGYHIPIWLILTIFFISLFMASVKRHAELIVQGKKTRLSLMYYEDQLLDFLTITFATSTIISYSSYTYFERPPVIHTVFSRFFYRLLPGFEARKWMMATIPFVVYGIARYAQLLYESRQGEMPEKVITTDIPLITSVAIWGAIVILLIYVL